MPNYVPLRLPPDKLDELSRYLMEKFRLTVQARCNQVDNLYRRWQDNYAAKPLEEVRTTPFHRASNFMPQLIRMHSDILSARLLGIIFSCHPFWKPRSIIGDLPHEYLEALAEWMEFQTVYQLELFEPLDLGVAQTVRFGTTVFKAPWITEEYFLTGVEGGSNKVTKKSKEGMIVEPIPYDDFWPYPITARNLKKTTIQFHRIRLTKEQCQYRINTGYWDKEPGERVLNAMVQPSTDTKRSSEAQDAGITLTVDVSAPYSVIEAWLEYELVPGQMHRIIVTFNPFIEGKEGILRSIYNYYSKGGHCFADMRIAPRDDLFYGYGLAEQLEQSQEEQAQIHNARRDSNLISNVPGWKKKRYADVPNPSSDWYPGKVWELDNLDDLDIIQFPVKYNDMIDEEQFILTLAERYSGIGAPMQGFGAGVTEGKRGIYNAQGTMQMLAEGNRRLDIYIKRLRYPLHTIGNLIYQSNRDFRPQGQEFVFWGENGKRVQKTFQLMEPEGFGGLFFDISASDSSANKEIDRTNLLLMANTLAGYYRQVTEIAQIITQVPNEHPLRPIMLSVLDGARDLANRILFYYDLGDRNRMLPDVRAVLEGGAGASAGGIQFSAGPGAEGAISREDLQALSGRLTALTSGGNGGFGQSGRPQ